jgi:hypothetical protein
MITCSAVSDYISAKWNIEQSYLDRGEDNATVRVLKLRYHTLTYVLAFLLVTGLIAREGSEDSNAAPF